MSATPPAPSAAAIVAGMTIAAVLRQSPLDALETRILLAHGLKLTRVQLITQSERSLSNEEADTLNALFERRRQGEPVAYLLGEREFFGLNFIVSPDVLIPRPETELLVELALEHLPQQGRVLDLGTGSGAIAIAIAHQCRTAEVTALDVSPNALAIAGRNAERHQVPVRFLQSDWYDAIGDARFDTIVANPPYIVSGDPHLSQGDLRFEPIGALTDHADGLSALRTIVAGAPMHLAPGGWLFMEHGYDQAAAVRALLSESHWADVQSWKDLAGIERISGGRLV